MTPFIAIIERIPRSLRYSVVFLHAPPDKDGNCVIWNPNKPFGDKNSHILIHETDFIPEEAMLKVSLSQLEALLETPDEQLGDEWSTDLAIKKAYHRLVHCRKCGEHLKDGNPKEHL